MRRFLYLGIILSLLPIAIISGCGGSKSGGGGTQYTLNITVEGQGTVTPASGTKYKAGTVVTLDPVPNSHWIFTEWDGPNKSNVVNDNGVWKITMNSNKSLTARFVQLTHNLTVNTTGQGTVSQMLKITAKTVYNEGNVVELTANPDTGWCFNHWEGDVAGADTQTR